MGAAAAAVAAAAVRGPARGCGAVGWAGGGREGGSLVVIAAAYSVYLHS